MWARRAAAVVVAHERRGRDHAEPEVGDAGATVVADQHVVGLEVAVDDAARVRGGEPLRGLREHREHGGGRARLPEPRAQARARDVLHDEEHAAVVDADLEHGHDVGMRQPGHHARLGEQVGGRGLAEIDGVAGGGDRLAGQHLDRDLAIELGVARAIHDAAAAGAEHADDVEARDRPAHRDDYSGVGTTVSITSVPGAVGSNAWSSAPSAFGRAAS